LRKYLSKDIWNQLKEKNDSYNFSFREAIFSGIRNTDSGIGVYAGSHNSYTAFAPMFDKIIEDYHGHSKSDVHQAENPNVGLNAPDFPPEEAEMIISTRIRVGRNMDGFPLGPGVTEQQRAEIESNAVTALNSFEGELKGNYYSLSSMTDS
jgi:arginine kinase|tara:strand:+ start:831 stop:1283 length:453 start_codon:yes stop_codon:yes gene_type:complete